MSRMICTALALFSVVGAAQADVVKLTFDFKPAYLADYLTFGSPVLPQGFSTQVSFTFDTTSPDYVNNNAPYYINSNLYSPTSVNIGALTSLLSPGYAPLGSYPLLIGASATTASGFSPLHVTAALSTGYVVTNGATDASYLSVDYYGGDSSSALAAFTGRDFETFFEAAMYGGYDFTMAAEEQHYSDASSFDLRASQSDARLVSMTIDGRTISVVPEPAGLALALAGLGIVGASFRRATRR